RATWRWSFAHDMREQAARSMPAMLHFFDHRGRIQEGLAILREAGESDAARSDRKLHALVLSAIAHLRYRLDRYAEAEGDALRALETTEPGDQQARLQCLRVLGGCCLRLGRLEDARRYYRQALKLAPATIDPGTAAALLDNLALVAKYRGEYSESLKLS